MFDSWLCATPVLSDLKDSISFWMYTTLENKNKITIFILYFVQSESWKCNLFHLLTIQIKLYKVLLGLNEKRHLHYEQQLVFEIAWTDQDSDL